jgi:hypothetical protein
VVNLFGWAGPSRHDDWRVLIAADPARVTSDTQIA